MIEHRDCERIVDARMIADDGVIVVPSDRLQVFLTDRTPSLKDAIRYIEVEFPEATTFPIAVIAVEHDGVSAVPLPKKKTNRGDGTAKKRKRPPKAPE